MSSRKTILKTLFYTTSVLTIYFFANLIYSLQVNGISGTVFANIPTGNSLVELILYTTISGFATMLTYGTYKIHS